MAAFTQTIHASANGVSLIEAADYAAMRTALGLGTIATQAANSVNIDGGAIDGTTIGANAAAAGTFATVTTSGAIGAQGAVVTGFPFTGYQTVNGQGVKVFGEGDQNAEYVHMYVAADGSGYFYSSGWFALASADDNVSITAGATKSVYMSAGGLFYFLDVDAAGATRATISSATGEIAIPSDTVGLKLDASGTTTLYSNGTSIIINKPLTLGGDLDCNGNTIHFGTAENEATINTTPSPNTCTVNLHAENHWTIPANDADDDITATITVPPGPTAGTILIEQGVTPRDITFVASAGTIAWLGTEPTWNDASEASEIHGISWRWNGTYFLMSDAGKTSITP